VKLRIALVPFLLVAAAVAQMAPTPSAEVKKLDYFVGSWTTEGTVAQGPWGPGGKFTSTISNEWMAGNFFLVGHSDFKMPPEIGGEGKSTSFKGYDTNDNVYTFAEFNSQGRREISKGTLSADTWTWNSSQVYSGQDVKQRMTIKMLSPTSYTLKFELSMDGANWMTFMDGKATKK
jgi:hypothetical protein